MDDFAVGPICFFENDEFCDVPDFCPPGTDLVDCQCNLLNNNVCDEPYSCAVGTDIDDCENVTPCSYTEDGECDEPEWCAFGTDMVDCNPDECPFANDGECDVPLYCPWDSDTADCGEVRPGGARCEYVADGFCDEPDFCPWGSDTEDCAGAAIGDEVVIAANLEFPDEATILGSRYRDTPVGAELVPETPEEIRQLMVFKDDFKATMSNYANPDGINIVGVSKGSIVLAFTITTHIPEPVDDNVGFLLEMIAIEGSAGFSVDDQGTKTSAGMITGISVDGQSVEGPCHPCAYGEGMNTCTYANDGYCDEGCEDYADCACGTDKTDCTDFNPGALANEIFEGCPFENDNLCKPPFSSIHCSSRPCPKAIHYNTLVADLTPAPCQVMCPFTARSEQILQTAER